MERRKLSGRSHLSIKWDATEVGNRNRPYCPVCGVWNTQARFLEGDRARSPHPLCAAIVREAAAATRAPTRHALILFEKSSHRTGGLGGGGRLVN
jgi:hypothetical protein